MTESIQVNQEHLRERRANSGVGFTYSEENTHDLSGLPNRNALMEAMDNAICNPELSANFGVIFADLDGLKEVNDQEGHHQGDKYLLYTASALSDSTRPEDLATVVTHLGGDEFAVLVANVNDIDVLTSIKKRLQNNLEEIGVPTSMGVALHTPGMSPSQLLQTADHLMYEDKIERKLDSLTPKQEQGYLQLGEIAVTYDLNLRDAAAIIPALTNR